MLVARKPGLFAATFIVGIVVLAALPAGAVADGSPCPNADANVADVALPDFETSVLCLLNERRAENGGLAPLRSNGLLHDAAYIYATSMLSGRFYDHDGNLVGGDAASTPVKRLRFLGYIRPGWSWIVGEVMRGAHPDTSTPDLVVEAWLESPLHRVEILKPRFRDVGISAVHGITDGFPSTDGVTVVAELGFHEPKKRKGAGS
jgi:uncharacterized protein YkwD